MIKEEQRSSRWVRGLSTRDLRKDFKELPEVLKELKRRERLLLKRINKVKV